MANEAMNIEAVKSVCNELEKSPSCKQTTSNYGGTAKGGKLRMAAGAEASAGKMKTGELHTGKMR